MDVRYHGQGLLLTIDVELEALRQKGLAAIGDQFDDVHRQLFTFALFADKELVNLRAVVQGRAAIVKAPDIAAGGADPRAARVGGQPVHVDGVDRDAAVYDRAKLAAGNRIAGPAIVVEMDATTVILPEHVGEVDQYGNILIRPAQD